MSDITPTRIAEIRARLEAATPGPWEWTGNALDQSENPYQEVISTEVSCGAYCLGGMWAPGIDEDDKALIAHAPADLADLLAALDAAQANSKQIVQHATELCAERDQWKQQFEESCDTLAPLMRLFGDCSAAELFPKVEKLRGTGEEVYMRGYRDGLAVGYRTNETERTALSAECVLLRTERDALRAEVARLGPEQVEREFQGHWTSVSDDNPIEHAALLKGIGVKLRTIRVVQEGAGDAAEH